VHIRLLFIVKKRYNLFNFSDVYKTKVVMSLNVEDLIELLKQDKLLPEQARVITYGYGNRKFRELIDRLETKGLAQYVDTFESGYVIKTQTIPKEIARFVNLRVLNLNGHTSLEQLPATIGQLSKLECLFLRDAKQIHIIPSEIGQLKNLRVLSITNCALTELPPEIGQLESLEELNLHSNQLTTLPPEIGNLRNLKVLNVGFNPLQSLPDEIGRLRNLECLDVNFSPDLPIPQTFLLMHSCKVNSGRLTAPFYAFEAKEIRKEAAKYAVASKVMAQGARTMPDSAARYVFAMPELRSHIASFVGWHPSFNSGQPNAGFAERFETAQTQRTAISEYDFLTKIIQRPKF